LVEPTLRLRHSDMLRAVEEIDLVDVVAQELIDRAASATDRRPASRLATNHASVAATDLTHVGDPDGGRACLMPTQSLQMLCLAGLAGLAARELLPPGVVTAAVLGSGAAARLHLGLVSRYIPNVSHVAVYPGGVEAVQSAEWNVLDGLELAGIALSSGTSSQDAALGANLVVVAELGWDRLGLAHLSRGVLVINASRRDLPEELLTEVDRVYVNDLELLEHNQHRTFVRMHQAGADPRDDQIYRRHEGWFQRQRSWRHGRRVENDLGHVLAEGGHPRVDNDEVVLVELMAGGALDTRLAGHIHRAAIALGLGRAVNQTEKE